MNCSADNLYSVATLKERSDWDMSIEIWDLRKRLI